MRGVTRLKNADVQHVGGEKFHCCCGRATLHVATRPFQHGRFNTTCAAGAEPSTTAEVCIMSDELNPGAGPDSAASPTAAPSGVAALPQEAKDAALRLMAQADDAADFVAEKRDQEAEHRGEPEAPPKRTSRHERYKRAIERLRQENMQLRGGDVGAADGATNNTVAPER